MHSPVHGPHCNHCNPSKPILTATYHTSYIPGHRPDATLLDPILRAPLRVLYEVS